jgi:2-keto-4-pentenoate hydratase
VTVDEIHPRVVSALDAQLTHWRDVMRGGARRIGWKLALGVEPVEEVIGDEPVIGYLTSATLLRSGEVFGANAARELRAETELAPSRESNYKPGTAFSLAL